MIWFVAQSSTVYLFIFATNERTVIDRPRRPLKQDPSLLVPIQNQDVAAQQLERRQQHLRRQHAVLAENGVLGVRSQTPVVAAGGVVSSSAGGVAAAEVPPARGGSPGSESSCTSRCCCCCCCRCCTAGSSSSAKQQQRRRGRGGRPRPRKILHDRYRRHHHLNNVGSWKRLRMLDDVAGSSRKDCTEKSFSFDVCCQGGFLLVVAGWAVCRAAAGRPSFTLMVARHHILF